jgi:hypothetical protein
VSQKVPPILYPECASVVGYQAREELWNGGICGKANQTRDVLPDEEVAVFRWYTVTVVTEISAIATVVKPEVKQ